MKYSIALSVLPFSLMFASFAPLWFFAEALADALGIPPNAPVKEQPNGLLWLILFLTVMVIFMIVGCLLGFLLNALIMRWAFGWSWGKLRELFLFSQVPKHWLRNGQSIGK